MKKDKKQNKQSYRSFLNRYQFFIVSALLIFSLLFHLTLFNKGFFYGDMTTFQGWGNQALEKGISSLYMENPTDYPPLYMYVLKLNSWISVTLFRTNELTHKSYVFISKIVPTLCTLLLGLGIYLFLYKKSVSFAMIAMMLYLFNPAIVYDSAYWGQVDSVNTLFMFASIFLLIRKKYLFSWVAITIATLIKIQSVILFPLIFFVTLLDGGVREMLKIIIINTCTSLFFLLPYIFGGVFWEMLHIIFGSVGRWPYVTMNAYNLWYILFPTMPAGWNQGMVDTTLFLGISLKSLGLLLFAGYLVLVLYKLSKNISSDMILFASSGVAFAFFMLPTQMHERYLFPLFVFLVVLAVEHHTHLFFYLITSALFLLNLMFVFRFESSHWLFGSIDFLIIPLFSSDYLLTSAATIIAALFLILFILFSKEYVLKGTFSDLKEDWNNIKKRVLKGNS